MALKLFQLLKSDLDRADDLRDKKYEDDMLATEIDIIELYLITYSGWPWQDGPPCDMRDGRGCKNVK